MSLTFPYFLVLAASREPGEIGMGSGSSSGNIFRAITTTAFVALLGLAAAGPMANPAKNLCQLAGPSDWAYHQWCIDNLAPAVGNWAWGIVAAAFVLMVVSWLSLFVKRRPKVQTPDITVWQAVDYLVNDARVALKLHGRYVEATGKVTDDGAESFAAVLLLNEAAAAHELHFWGERQQPLKGYHYENHTRPIPDDYWDGAQIDWWNSLDDDGYPQSKPSGHVGADFLTYRKLQMNMAEVRRKWRPKSAVRRLVKAVTFRPRIGKPKEMTNWTPGEMTQTKPTATLPALPSATPTEQPAHGFSFNNAEGVKMYGCVSEGNAGDGIHVENSSGTVIAESTSRGNAGHGISVKDSPASHLHGNLAENNGPKKGEKE